MKVLSMTHFPHRLFLMFTAFAAYLSAIADVKVQLLDPDNKAIRCAADDLCSDLIKVAGESEATSLASKITAGNLSDLGKLAVKGEIKKFSSQLKGKWEAYRVFTHNGRLYILGSDTRGTMWGIYAFSETCLGVDPMYFWTEKEPETKNDILRQDIELASDGPSFKLRGWFINDEDFLTEWEPFDGRRNNDYKYYSKIIHPEVTDRIIETALRLKMNMIIPSSFNDILNPPEAYAIRKAAERGLIVTQHHIEPLGVGGFNFDDYFAKQGKEIPLFSYLKNPEQMKKVWEAYVKAWSAFPDVIWQLGLRGRGDMAMWLHDPSVPKDEAARGAIISEAIKTQYDLVRKYDPDAYFTLTLWLEMARLMEHGHIKIPDDITIIFADNSPGWGFSPDFYQVKREKSKQYGIYYHHQLWGSGPHFIQGIPPQKTYEVIKEAVNHDSDTYCVLNVGNIREFVLGLKLSSELLFDLKGYDVKTATRQWFTFHYGKWADDAEHIYQNFFDHYLLDRDNKYKVSYSKLPNTPYLLDGHLAFRMKYMLIDLNQSYALPEFKGKSWTFAGELRPPKELKWNDREEEMLSNIRKQNSNLEAVIKEVDSLYTKIDGYPAQLFDVNLRTPAKMFSGLMNCVAETMLATKAEKQGNRNASVEHLQTALKYIDEANEIKQSMQKGKWAGWYRGEYKIMFSSYAEFLHYLINGATKKKDS